MSDPRMDEFLSNFNLDDDEIKLNVKSRIDSAERAGGVRDLGGRIGEAPAAYDFWATGEEPAKEQENMLFDFVGNALWALTGQMSFGAANIADLAKEGALAKKFGSDPWAEESVAGKAGYVLGEVVGLLGSFGLAKGVQKGVAGIGSAVVGNYVKKEGSQKITAKLTEKLGETGFKKISEKLGDDALSHGWDAVNKVKASSGVWGYQANIQRFGVEVRSQISKNLRKTFSKTDEFGKVVSTIDDKVLKTMTDEVFEVAAKTAPGSLNVAIAARFGRAAPYVERALAESTLMAIHTTMATTSSIATAKMLDREDIVETQKKEYFHALLISMGIGAAMPLARKIPGGKAVEGGMMRPALSISGMLVSRTSGMLADIGHIAKMVRRNSSEWLTANPNAQRSAIRRMQVTDPSFLDKFATKWKPRQIKQFLKQGGHKVQGATEFYDEIFSKVRKVVSEGPGVFDIIKEMGADFMGSFGRMVAGSMIFNGPHWISEMDLPEEQKTPFDKKVIDFVTGMLWAKRGYTPGATKFGGKFYNKELGQSLHNLQLMGLSPSKAVDFAHHYELYSRTPEGAIANAIMSSSELKEVTKIIGDENLVDNAKYTAMIGSEQYVDFKTAYKSLVTKRENKLFDLTDQLEAAEAAGDVNSVKNITRNIKHHSKKIKNLKSQYDKFELVHDKMTGADIETRMMKPVRRSSKNEQLSEQEVIETLKRFETVEINDRSYKHIDDVRTAIDDLARISVEGESILIQSGFSDYIFDSLRLLGLVTGPHKEGASFQIDTNTIEKINDLKKTVGVAEREALSELISTLETWKNVAYTERETLGEKLTINSENIAEVVSRHREFNEDLHKYVYEEMWNPQDGLLAPRLVSNDGWSHAVKRWRYDLDINNAFKILRGTPPEQLTNAQGDLQSRINIVYDGRSKLKVKFPREGETPDVDATTSKDLEYLQAVEYIENLNKARNMSGRAGKGEKEITLAKAKEIMTSTTMEFGDFLSTKDGLRDFINNSMTSRLREFTSDPHNEKYSAGLAHLLTDIDAQNLVVVNSQNGKFTMFTEKQVRDHLSQYLGRELNEREEADLMNYNELVNTAVSKMSGTFNEWSGDRAISNQVAPGDLLNQIRSIKIRMDIKNDSVLQKGLERATRALDDVVAGIHESILEKGESSEAIREVMKSIQAGDLRDTVDIQAAIREALVDREGSGNKNFAESAGYILKSAIDAQKIIYQWGRGNLDTLKGLLIGGRDLYKALNLYEVLGKPTLEMLLDSRRVSKLEENTRKLNIALIEAVNKFKKDHPISDEASLERYINRVMSKFEVQREEQVHTNRYVMSIDQIQSRYGLSSDYLDIFRGTIKNLNKADQRVRALFDNFSDGIAQKAGMEIQEVRNLLKNSNDIFSVLGELRNFNLNEVKNYVVENLFEPLIRGHAELIQLALDRKQTLRGMKEGVTSKEFIQDMIQLIPSGLGRRSILTGYFDNGRIVFSEMSKPNYTHGYVGLLDLFGLSAADGPGFLLEQSKAVFDQVRWNKAQQDGFITQDIRRGAHLVESPKDAGRRRLEGDEEAPPVLVGTGLQGEPRFHRVTLDEKVNVFVSGSTSDLIRDKLQQRTSMVRLMLENTLGNDTERFLRGLGLLTSESYTDSQLSDALWITRLAMDNSFLLSKARESTRGQHGNQQTIPEVLHDIKSKQTKYLSMPEATSGTAFVLSEFYKTPPTNDKRNGGIARRHIYSPVHATLRLMESFRDVVPEFTDPIRVIRDRMVGDPDNPYQMREMRQLLINDKGDSFDTLLNARVLLGRDLAKRHNITEEVAAERYEREIAEILKEIEIATKESTDAATFASLDEMIFSAVGRGAKVFGNENWFQMEGNQITGVNFATKPVTTSNRVYKAYGDHRTFYSKTADVYIPNVLSGKLYDKITFTSAGKKAFRGTKDRDTGIVTYDNEKVALGMINRDTGEAPEVGRYFGRYGIDNFVADLRSQVTEATNENIYFIDRADVMLKSVAYPHAASVSYGFGHFLGNMQQNVLARWLGSAANGERAAKALAAVTSGDPYEVAAYASHLIGFEMERGDASGKITGIEAILNEVGFPIFSRNELQMRRTVAASYIRNSNFGSGEVEHGSTSVMFPDFGKMTLPFREGGVQRYAGGTSMNFLESRQNAGVLFTSGSGDSRGSLSFGISGTLADRLNKAISKNVLKFKTELAGGYTKRPDGTTAFSLFRAGDQLNLTVKGDGVSLYGGLYSLFERMAARRFEEGRDYAPGQKGRDINSDMVTFDRIIRAELGEKLDYAVQHVKDMAENNDLTFGELILRLDGRHGEQREPFNITDHNWRSDYYVTNERPGAFVKDPKFEGDFQTLHIGLLKMRNPKDSLNGWVHQNVEMITDARSGNIHKTNILDILNPLDADFDIDKSISYYGVPADIMKQTYSYAGLSARSDSDMIETAIRVDLTERGIASERISDYIHLWRDVDLERGPVLRHFAVLSTLLNFGETRAQGLEKIFPIPGEVSQRVPYAEAREQMLFGFEKDASAYIDLASVQGKTGATYTLSLKGGKNVSNSVDFLKNLGKHAIDYYVLQTEPGILKQKVWDTYFHGEYGIFDLYKTGYGKERVRIESGDPMYETLFGVTPGNKGVVTRVLEQLANFHNLSKGEEKTGVGKMKLTPEEYVMRLWDIRTNLKKLTYGKYGDLTPLVETFVNSMLGFLKPATEFTRRLRTPFAEGLFAMELAMGRNKQELHTDINDEITHALSDGLTDQGRSLLNQKLMALFTKGDGIKETTNFIAQEMSRIRNVQDEIRNRFRRGYAETERWQWTKQKRSKIEAVRDAISDAVQDERIVNSYKVNAFRKPSKKRAFTDIAIYRRGVVEEGKGIFHKVKGFSKGSVIDIPLQKGDRIVLNPRRIVGVDAKQQLHGEASIVAYSNPSSLLRVQAKELVKVLYAKINNNTKGLPSFETPETAVKFADYMYKVNETMREFYTDTVRRHGEEMFEEIIFEMMTPRYSQDKITIDKVIYANNFRSMYGKPVIERNARNEMFVSSFLGSAAEGKIANVDRTFATRLLTKIYKAHRNAVVHVHNPLVGWTSQYLENFLNLYASANDVRAYKFYEQSPAWMFSEIQKGTRATRANNHLMRYITGEILLSPVELMKHTIALVGVKNISAAWKGGLRKEVSHRYNVDLRFGMGEPKKRYGRNHQSDQTGYDYYKKQVPEEPNACSN